jgi:hypothetical protein
MQTILLIEDAPASLVARSLILRCFGYTVLCTAFQIRITAVLRLVNFLTGLSPGSLEKLQKASPYFSPVSRDAKFG